MGSVSQGVSPDRFRELSKLSGSLSEAVESCRSSASRMIQDGDLTCAVDVLGLCKEVWEEMGLLADLTESKAADIETASCSAASLNFQKLLDSSLRDDVGRKIPVEELKSKMAVAVENDDKIEIERLSGLLWEQVAALEPEDAEYYLQKLDAPAVFLALQVTDFPRIQGVVDYVSWKMVGRSNPGWWDDPFTSYLAEQYGIELNEQEKVQQFAQSQLIEFSRVSGLNAQMVIDRLPVFHFEQRDAAAEMLELVIRENPREFAAVVEADVKQAQGIADLLTDERPTEVLQELLNLLVGLTIDDYRPGSATADEAYNNESLAAAAVFCRSLEAKGKGISINWDKVVSFGLKRLGPIGKTVATLKSFVTIDNDDIGSRRNAEFDRDFQIKELALTIMAANNPEYAKSIMDHMDMDKPLSQEWHNVPSGAGDDTLGQARDRLEEIESTLSDAWDEGND